MALLTIRLPEKADQADEDRNQGWLNLFRFSRRPRAFRLRPVGHLGR